MSPQTGLQTGPNPCQLRWQHNIFKREKKKTPSQLVTAHRPSKELGFHPDGITISLSTVCSHSLYEAGGSSEAAEKTFTLETLKQRTLLPFRDARKRSQVSLVSQQPLVPQRSEREGTA